MMISSDFCYDIIWFESYSYILFSNNLRTFFRFEDWSRHRFFHRSQILRVATISINTTVIAFFFVI